MAQDLLLHILNCYYYYTVGKLPTNLSNPVVFAAAGLTLTSLVYRVVRPGLRCAVNDIKVYLGMIKVCVWVYRRCDLPKFICDENDPSLQDSCCKHQQHLLVRQAAKERGKVDVFQPGIQRPGQTDDLVESHHCHKYVNSGASMSSLNWQGSAFQLFLYHRFFIFILLPL